MNISLDELIRLEDIAKQLPNRPHLATIYRWTTRGIRGVNERRSLLSGTTTRIARNMVAG
jgi:hypothetical protein